VLRNADVISSNLSRFGPNNECTAPCSETIRLLCFALRIARFPLPSLRSEKICVCVCVCRCACMCASFTGLSDKQQGINLVPTACLRIRISIIVFLQMRKRIVYSALCLSVRPVLVFLLLAAMNFDGM
jgi:hypothetical protein